MSQDTIKDRVEQRVALGRTAEDIAELENLPLAWVLEIMTGMDEAHRERTPLPAAPGPHLRLVRETPEPARKRGIASKGCAICFRRRTPKPHGICWECTAAADRWEATLTPSELTELDAAMKRHPAGSSR